MFVLAANNSNHQSTLQRTKCISPSPKSKYENTIVIALPQQNKSSKKYFLAFLKMYLILIKFGEDDPILTFKKMLIPGCCYQVCCGLKHVLVLFDAKEITKHVSSCRLAFTKHLFAKN